MIYIPNDRQDTLVIDGLFIALPQDASQFLDFTKVMNGELNIKNMEITNNIITGRCWVQRPSRLHKLLMKLKFVPNSDWVLRDVV